MAAGQYNVAYNIAVTDAGGAAAKTLESLATQAEKLNNALRGVTSVGAKSGLNTALTAMNNWFGGKDSKGKPLNYTASAIKNRVEAINQFSGAVANLGNAYSKFGANDKAIRGVTSAINTIKTAATIGVSKDQLTNVKTLVGHLTDLTSKLAYQPAIGADKLKGLRGTVTALASAAKAFSGFTVNSAQVSAANGVISMLETLGKLSVTKQADSKNMRSLASSMTSMGTAVQKLTEKTMYGKLSAVRDMFKELSGLSKHGGFTVDIDISSAQANLDTLRKDIIKTMALMKEAGIGKVRGGGAGGSSAVVTTPGKKGGGGRNGGGNVPKNAGGLQVFASAAPMFYGNGKSSIPSGLNVYGGGKLSVFASNGGNGSGPAGGGGGGGGSNPPHIPNHSGYADWLSRKPKKPVGFGIIGDDDYKQKLRAWRREGRQFIDHGPAIRRIETYKAKKLFEQAYGMSTREYFNSIGRGRFMPEDALVARSYANSNWGFTDREVGAWRSWNYPFHGLRGNGNGGWITSSGLPFDNAYKASWNRFAARALYESSHKLIIAHQQFNAQLASNLRAAQAEAQAAGGMGGYMGIAGPTNLTEEQNKALANKMNEDLRKRYPGRYYDPTTDRGWQKGLGAKPVQVPLGPNAYRMSGDRLQREQMYARMFDEADAKRINDSNAKNARSRIYNGNSYGVRNRARMKSNIGYKVLGPSMLDSGGLGIASMLKGMGVMYGISGLGSMFGSALRDYAEYDNLMQSTKNILGAHYKGNSFFEDIAGMSSIIRRVGVETKYTAPQVSDAAKFLAMAGYNIDDIKTAIRPISNIALIGDTDLGETADVVTNIMTGYSIPSTRLKQATDIMTNTFTMSNTTLMELGEALKYSGGLLNAYNIPLQESVAALGILGNAGIKGSQAGTTMRGILNNLKNPTLNQASAWEKLGLKDKYGNDLIKIVTGANGKRKVENYILKDQNGRNRSLLEIFGLLANSEQEVDVSKLFYRTAVQGAVALMGNTQRWNEIMANNYMAEGMAEKLANAKKETISGQWAQLTSMFTEDAIQSFGSVGGTISGFLQRGINALDPENKNGGSSTIKKTISDMVGLLDDVADTSATIFGLWSKFGGFVTTFFKIQMQIMPILFGLRAIKSLINIGSGAYTGVKSIGNFTSGIGQWTRNTFSPGRTNYYSIGGRRGKFKDVLGFTKDPMGRSNFYLSDPSTRLRFMGDRFTIGNKNRFKYNDVLRGGQRYINEGTMDLTREAELSGKRADRIGYLRMLSSRRRFFSNLGGGVGAIGGGIGGMFAGDWIARNAFGAEEGGAGQMIGMALGGAAGTVGIGLLGSKMAVYLANPWVLLGTIIASIGAGLVGSFISARKHLQSLQEGQAELNRIAFGHNGYNAGKDASLFNKLGIANLDDASQGGYKNRLELLAAQGGYVSPDAGRSATFNDVSPMYARGFATYLKDREDATSSWFGVTAGNALAMYNAALGLKNGEGHYTAGKSSLTTDGFAPYGSFGNISETVAKRGSFGFGPTLGTNASIVRYKDYLTNPFSGGSRLGVWFMDQMPENTKNAEVNFARTGQYNYAHSAGWDTEYGVYAQDYKNILSRISSEANSIEDAKAIVLERINFWKEKMDLNAGKYSDNEFANMNMQYHPLAVNAFAYQWDEVFNNPNHPWNKLINDIVAFRAHVNQNGPDMTPEAQKLYGNILSSAGGTPLDGLITGVAKFDGKWMNAMQRAVYDGVLNANKTLINSMSPGLMNYYPYYLESTAGGHIQTALQTPFVTNEQIKIGTKDYVWIGNGTNKYVDKKLAKWNSVNDSYTLNSGVKLSDKNSYGYEEALEQQEVQKYGYNEFYQEQDELPNNFGPLSYNQDDFKSSYDSLENNWYARNEGGMSNSININVSSHPLMSRSQIESLVNDVSIQLTNALTETTTA